RDGMYVTPQIDFLTDAGAKLSRPMKSGDVVIAVSGNPGLPAILNSDACIHDGFVRFRHLDTKRISNVFLYHFLKANKDKTNSKAVGAIFKNLTTDQLKEIEVPTPDLKTQQKIAGILEQADAARQKRKQANQLTEQFLQSAFLEMFGDPVRNEKGWEVKELGELGYDKNSIVDGPFGSSVNTKVDYIDDGEIPVIRTKNVGTFEFFVEDLKFMSREKFETVKRSSVIHGDIILTKVGTIGNVCIFPNLFSQAVLSTTGSCRIRVNRDIVNSIYLLHYLNLYKPMMMKWASTAVQAFLNMAQIKSFKVPLPPLPLQQKFAALVEQVERLRTKQRESERELENLFQSLMQKYFG
ncbi:MAG: restriction endonuclease subunit S, partial [Flammeovirgaceae bacterium]